MFFFKHNIIIKHTKYESLVLKKRLTIKQLKEFIYSHQKNDKKDEFTVFIAYNLMSKREIKKIIKVITNRKPPFLILKNEKSLNQYVSNQYFQFYSEY